MVKRSVDILVSLMGLIILWPFIGIIAILVKLDSPGPVFYKGTRIGRYGKRFEILKFRSMIADASRRGASVTCQGDPRITRLGHFLRDTKLDELPNLINVLKGEMSLVGPRPEAPDWVERYTPRQRKVLTVRPGITGLSQIKFRHEEALLSGDDLETAYSRVMSDKLEIDLDYVANHSFFMDMRILLGTVTALFERSDSVTGGYAAAHHSKKVNVARYQSGLFGQYARRIMLDLLLIPCAFYLAWFIRFDGSPSGMELAILTRYLLPLAMLYILVNASLGIYRHLWAYASFRDVILLSAAAGLSTLVLILCDVAMTGFRGYRLSIGGLIIGSLLALIGSTAIKYRHQLIAIFIATWPRSDPTNPERVLIVGMNETAQQLATQIYLGRCTTNYELVGFVDDDPHRHGMSVNGAKILGTTQQVAGLVRDRHIDVIIIARRPDDQAQMWKLIAACQATPAQIKVLPDIIEVMHGCYSDPLTLRDVSVEDLLSRAPAAASSESFRNILADKVVLVTGAAGSIGSELCRQILCFEPKLLLALDNNETGLYDLNLALNTHGCAPLQLVIADVSDWQKIDRVFSQHRPQVVFHAAAYKHVPLVECHPDEAVRVNIIGTAAVCEMAHEYRAEHLVFISTDKAVNPSSVMGASKYIGELWIKAMSRRSDTLFTAVRFGNVIGSRGSVLPTFTRQIEAGGPVTVTHPEMRRFFMSIPEAVSLVLHAASLSSGGDVFMLDMDEEVSILALAQRMIRLKGLRVNKDIQIEFTGVRPGEKLREELAYDHEVKFQTAHPRIYRLQEREAPIDHDTLLGVCTLLAQTLNSGERRLREEIFRIARHDVDGFLTAVVGFDLMRHRRLSAPAAIRIDEEEAQHIPEQIYAPV